ncbi:MAG: hypothetical protein MUO52_07190, partial [Desulfobacterales bacterium]|nr:hypothetical protein [Desulfobacterales bacterium]
MARFLLLLFMLIGLPLLGIVVSHRATAAYFEFPPQTLYVLHAPFSWIPFAGYTLFILVVVTPFVVHGLRRRPEQSGATPFQPFPFPWWGWLGLLPGGLAWIMAWTRFPWFEAFQAHTFTPLWIAYIITMNALTYRRKGSSLLLHRPAAFLLLFPLSALFWWFFEYLNRFVQNWQYVGVQFGPLEYFLFATLPFSTVLPAFTATREWLLTFSWPQQKFRSFIPLRVQRPKLVASAVLLFAGFGLAAIGVWPNLLFPLLWVSPLLVIVSLQALSGEPHIFSDLARGDWQIVLASALTALVCGFFWEMWNDYSLAKWVYHVPFVHRFQVFEMPLLGYAGYL